MKITTRSCYFLCITILLILSACGPKLTPPSDSTATLEEVENPVVPEDTSEPFEASYEDLLKAGTAMKWYDDGYLVFVPQGEVTLGNDDYENNPVHNVILDDFWIYTFKVTNGQYQHCVATGACTLSASEPPYPDLEDPEIKDRPVTGVTWEQADSYCKWMNGRLPTEAEWEKAARGPESYTYPWGEDEPTCDLLNYEECENGDLSLVFEYPEGKSFYEAYDLAGNSFEWVSDWYQEEYISLMPETNPAGPPNGTERSVRGSSFKSGEDLIPSAQRFYLEPEKYRTDLGFRCVITETDPFANACMQTAFVAGVPAPWQPGPQPSVPVVEEGTCTPISTIKMIWYCANPALQQGNIDITITSDENSDAYLKSWSSDHGAFCIEGDPTTGCWGPELTDITFEICYSCTPDNTVETFEVYCDSGYTGIGSFTCEYVGGEQVPGKTCPAGFIYDPNKDICVKVGMKSDQCPTGYEYDSTTQCCNAQYAHPSSDADIPAELYLTCPPGYDNLLSKSTLSPMGEDYIKCKYWYAPSADFEECQIKTYSFDTCDEPPKDNPNNPACKNPGSYTSPRACVSANCKWIPVSSLGAPAKCDYP